MIALRQVPGNIVAALVFFVLGETGFVRKGPASAAAWIVGVLVVGAVVLGAPQKAEAVWCFDIPMTCWHPQVNCNQLCNEASEGRCAVGTCPTGSFCRCDDGMK